MFFFVIALYLTFRFEWRMALAAIIAVIHDIIITVGVYAVTGFEVTPATVVAFLTILGFSLYDTVVVFDKVKENQARLGTVRGDTYSTMVNRSLNQVLMRSINTSIVALLPVASLLFVGTLRARRRSRSATSRSRCSSACSPARTRRSSWPRRSSPGSRSASRSYRVAARARRRRPGARPGAVAGGGRARRSPATPRRRASTDGEDVDPGARRRRRRRRRRAGRRAAARPRTPAREPAARRRRPRAAASSAAGSAADRGCSAAIASAA